MTGQPLPEALREAQHDRDAKRERLYAALRKALVGALATVVLALGAYIGMPPATVRALVDSISPVTSTATTGGE